MTEQTVVTFVAKRRLKITPEHWREPDELLPEAHLWPLAPSHEHSGFIGRVTVPVTQFLEAVDKYAKDDRDALLHAAGVTEGVSLRGGTGQAIALKVGPTGELQRQELRKELAREAAAKKAPARKTVAKKAAAKKAPARKAVARKAAAKKAPAKLVKSPGTAPAKVPEPAPTVGDEGLQAPTSTPVAANSPDVENPKPAASAAPSD